PSNIHDNAYAIGAIDFTGDMPIILGPDGPSLGGFVCPAVVIHFELIGKERINILFGEKIWCAMWAIHDCNFPVLGKARNLRLS
ncbi:hypothetical protein, partial [Acinetobacter baumannii]|uniref:hypothetical protein n=1 Tax=Acinetobacter baumannii TaxID=470 RepID=UPI001CB7CB3C